MSTKTTIKFISSFFLYGLCSFSLSAASYTKTYSCDTCSITEAIELAKSLHQAPRCNTSNLEDGLIALGQTQFDCEETSKNVIISNPISRTSFKFEVKTRQISPYSSNYDVIVSELSMASFETKALTVFYDIHNDFRDAVTERMSGYIEPYTAPNSANNSAISLAPNTTFNSIDDSTNNAQSNSLNCDNHPLNYLFDTGGVARRNIHNSLSNDISSRIDYSESWSTFASESNLSGGVTIHSGSGLGINVNLSRNTKDVFAVAQFGSPDNVLSFTVKYTGEYFGEQYGFQSDGWIPTYGRDRNLLLAFTLNAGGSRIEGHAANEITGGNPYPEGTISECFKQILEANATKVTRTRAEDYGVGGSNGIPVGSGGTGVGGGGSVTPGASYLAGCYIVDVDAVIHYEDGRTSMSTTSYIDC